MWVVAGEGGFFLFFFFQRGMVATGQPTPSPDSPSPPRCLHWYAFPPSLFVRVFSKHVLRAFMVGSGAVTVPRLHGAWIGAWHCWQTVAGHGRRLQPLFFSFRLGDTYAMQTPLSSTPDALVRVRSFQSSWAAGSGHREGSASPEDHGDR